MEVNVVENGEESLIDKNEVENEVELDIIIIYIINK
jgi:hypothetical protein